MAAIKFLITGAAGFAGSHIAEEILSHENTQIISLDCLTYAGRLDRLAHLPRHRMKTVYHDFSKPLSDALLKTIGPVDYIIHNGAQSHVARSFQDPRIFVEANTIGTLNILEAARKLQPKKFLYVSTDEVFGPAQDIPFNEDSPLHPTNPYAATKAGGELLAYSYFRSFGLPVIISHTMNMFGERQHPEKFVPMTIGKVLRGEIVQIHGNSYVACDGYSALEGWEAGSRYWLHARAQGNALCFLLEHGTAGEKYNVAGTEVTNLEIYRLIVEFLGITGCWEWAESSRPVHDLHYAVDDVKLRLMGWKPPLSFHDSFKQTVLWTAANPIWLQE